MSRSVPGEPRHRGALRFGLVAAAIALLAAPATASAAPVLHRCADGAALAVRLAVAAARPGEARVGRRSRSPSAGCRRATPGAHRTRRWSRSRAARATPRSAAALEYTGIYGPLLRTRGLLLVDNRGTGGVGADPTARALQRYTGVELGRRVRRRVVAGCARQIDRRYGVRGAANLFATAYAADDLAAVLRRLRLGQVDLYGDSYGTWFAQSLHGAPPGALHSVVLDSAYPVVGLDPWYASSGADGARRARRRLRARPRLRGGRRPGSAVARLGALLDAPAHRTGAARTRAHRRRSARATARVGVRALVDLVQDAGSEPLVYRELDPAVRAALGRRRRAAAAPGRRAPSARTGRRQPTDYSGRPLLAPSPARTTRSCSRWARRPPTGARSWRRVDRRAPAGAFDAVHGCRVGCMSDNYTQPYRACLDWPRRAGSAPPVPADAAAAAGLGAAARRRRRPRLAHAAARRARARARGSARTCASSSCPTPSHVTSRGRHVLCVGAPLRARVIPRLRARARAARVASTRGCAAPHPATSTPPAPTRAAWPTPPPRRSCSGPDPGPVPPAPSTVAAGALGGRARALLSGARRAARGCAAGSFTAKGDPFVRLRLRSVRFAGDATVSGTGSWRLSDGATRGALAVRLPAAASCT